MAAEQKPSDGTGVKSKPCVILGLRHSTAADTEADMQSRSCISYRCDFSPIGSGWLALQTDAGWGCMLRSGQMMLCEAYKRRDLGRDWRLDHGENNDAYVNILELFYDVPHAPYGVHRLALAGEAFDKPAGQWFGPNTLCNVVKKLTKSELDSRNGAGAAGAAGAAGGGASAGAGGADGDTAGDGADRAVAVGQDGTVDHDKGGGSKDNVAFNGYSGDIIPVVVCEDSAIYGNDLDGVDLAQGAIVLIPLRHGLNDIQPTVVQQLAATLAFPQSIGFVGGKGQKAFWFFAVHSDADSDTVRYLDPHTMLPFDEELDLDTYRPSFVGSLALGTVDPSLALGFYCRNKDEFLELTKLLSQLGSRTTENKYPLVATGDKRPDFSVGHGSVMGGGGADSAGGDGGFDDSDDDSVVLI